MQICRKTQGLDNCSLSMKSKEAKGVIPPQKKGAKSDTVHTVKLKSHKDALDLFQIAKERLLKMYAWHQLCGMESAKFELTDAEGNTISRPAREGDYMRIDIPGPGSKTGAGYDWVRIKKILHEKDQERDYEATAIHVSPADNPRNLSSDTAHFFDQVASSTFLVTREKNVVTAEIHGRNEKPNTDPDKPIDVIRNTFIAIGAILGFSKLQWKQLAKGLLEYG